MVNAHVKKGMTRLLAALLCLCFACGWATVAAEEDAEEDEALLVRFAGMPVTLDDNGEPLLVNGYPLRTAKVSYFDKGQLKNYTFDVDILDYPFWQPSTTYDGNLAVMSLAMALSASRPVIAKDAPEDETDPSKNLELFLADAGFEDIRTDDYTKATSMYTVSTGIGHRRMEAEGEEPFTLIAVGICGSNYQNEWQSNMTPGTGEIHQGFLGAAQLVVDRLAGYIATRQIEGRVKVWVSGFSRAAAVSNLVAAILSDTGMLTKEDIYAYTFATPAAVHNPPSEGYEHIFNIICPTDLVPQVMPVDWGYGRYGRDRYLAVEEFSSILGSYVTQTRAERDKAMFDVENNYSPELNLRMRILISLLLDVIKSRDNYNRTFQPALVGIMQDKTIPNILTTLQNLMRNMGNSEVDEQSETDELMDFFIRVYTKSVTRTGLGATDRNTATAMYRLFNEHNENSYLSNMDAIRLGMFEDSTEACYVMVRGPVTLTIEYGDETIFSVDARGKLISGNEDVSDFLSNAYYKERYGDTTILAVPRDNDYTVTWTAEADGTVECMVAGLSVRASTRYPGGAFGPIQARAGDSGVAYRQVNGALALPDGFEERSFDGRALAEFIGIASLGINWRYAAMIICALIALLICMTLCLIVSFNERRRKKYSFWCWLTLCVFGIAAIEAEMAFWLFADQLMTRVIWKAVCAVCLILLFFMIHPPREPLLRSHFPALLLALAADITITFHFAAGAGLYLLSHIALILCFQRRAPMSGGRWFLWAAIAVPVTAGLALFFAPSRGVVGWVAVAFAPVVLLMNISASRQPFRARAAVAMFIAADLLLYLFVTLLNEPVVHMASMFCFYCACFLLDICDTDEPAASAAPPRVEGNDPEKLLMDKDCKLC